MGKKCECKKSKAWTSADGEVSPCVSRVVSYRGGPCQSVIGERAVSLPGGKEERYPHRKGGAVVSAGLNPEETRSRTGRRMAKRNIVGMQVSLGNRKIGGVVSAETGLQRGERG